MDIFFRRTSYIAISDMPAGKTQRSGNGRWRLKRDGKGWDDMYKRAVGLLALCSGVFMICFLCARVTDASRLCDGPARELRLEQVEKRQEQRAVQPLMVGKKELGIADVAVSGQRVVDFSVLDAKYVYHFSEEELEVLLRIVEAEAGNEDEDGKLLVANVVLNRVNSDKFPDTVKEVVFQREKGVSQFSPVYNGSYYKVTVSEETVSAVERALAGEDISQGALYFAARKYADSSKMRWFDTKLTYLFVYGGHEFFK